MADVTQNVDFCTRHRLEIKEVMRHKLHPIGQFGWQLCSSLLNVVLVIFYHQFQVRVSFRELYTYEAVGAADLHECTLAFQIENEEANQTCVDDSSLSELCPRISRYNVFRALARILVNTLHRTNEPRLQLGTLLEELE